MSEAVAAITALGGPLNRRAEMYGRFKQWLGDPAGVQIPDCDALQADAYGPGYRYDAPTRLILESKDDMRRRGALSPDLADAVVLSFAQSVSLAPSRFHRKIEYPPTGWR